MGTPSEGSPHPLVLSSTPLEGGETANSVCWPVEPVDGAPRFYKSVKSAQNYVFFLHSEVDLIKPGDTDTPVIPQQVCFSIREVCGRKKNVLILCWLLFLQRLRKFSKISFLRFDLFDVGSKPCPHISISRAPTAGF